jgi:hypothetical protein
LQGVLNFYPQKHFSVEPHSLGFQGSVYRLDTRFFKWLNTFPLSTIIKVPQIAVSVNAKA